MKKILTILGFMLLIGSGFAQENRLSYPKDSVNIALEKALESANTGDLNALVQYIQNLESNYNLQLQGIQTQIDNLGQVQTTNLSYTPSFINISVDSTQDVSWLTEIFGDYSSTTQGGSGTTTWITTIPANAFAQDLDSISITFEVKTTAQDILGASIGQQATSGDLYDRESGTISAFRFSDYTGLTTGKYTSAKLAYDYDHTKAYNIMLSNVNAYVYKNTTGLSDEVLGYFKASGQGDSLTADVTGYSNALPNWTNIIKVTGYYQGAGGNIDSTVYILAQNTGTGAITIDSVAIGSIFTADIFDNTLSPSDTSSIHITIPLTTAGGTYTSTAKVYYNGSVTPDNLSVTATIVSLQTDPPVTLPATPTGLVATAQTEAIKLDWTDVQNETRYRIFRSSTSGGTYTQIDSVSSNVTTYTNTGLTGGATWYYKIASYNANGQSALTSYVTATALTVPVQSGSLIVVAPNGTSGGAGTLADPKSIDWLNANKGTLTGGDTIGIPYGSVFTKKLLDLDGVAGEEGNPITIMAYGGSGHKPIINWGNQLSSWSYDAGSGLYRCASTNYKLLYWQAGEDSIIAGVYKSTLGAVTGKWDYRYESGYYYVVNPNVAQSLWVTTSTDRGAIRGNSSTAYINIYNLDVRYVNEYNVFFNGSRNVVLYDCNTFASGNDNYTDGSEVGFGFKFQSTLYCGAVNCFIQATGAHGLDFSVYHDLAGQVSVGNYSIGNTFKNTNYTALDVMNSFGAYNSPPLYTAIMRDITVKHNIFIEDENAAPYAAECIQFQGRPTYETLANFGDNFIRQIVCDSNIIYNWRRNAIYPSWSCDSVYVRGNIAIITGSGGGIALTDASWDGGQDRLNVAEVTGNYVYLKNNTGYLLWVNRRTPTINVNNNRYYSANGLRVYLISKSPTTATVDNSGGSIVTWRANTGWDSNSTYQSMPFDVNSLSSMRSFLGF